MLIFAILLGFIALNGQMGEAIGTEAMRQEMEEANEEEVYEETDTTEGPRYNDKPTEKVDEETIEEMPEGVVNEELEEEITYSEEKYESSAWVYVMLVIVGLLAIFAFYRYKIKKGN